MKMKNIKISRIGTIVCLIIFGIGSFAAGIIFTKAGNSEPSKSSLPVSKGGTGGNNFNIGEVLIGNGQNSFQTRGLDAAPTEKSDKFLTSGTIFSQYQILSGTGGFDFKIGDRVIGSNTIFFRYDKNSEILYFRQNGGAKNYSWVAAQSMTSLPITVLFKLPTNWKITFSSSLGYQSLESGLTHRYGGSGTQTYSAAGISLDPLVFYLPTNGTSLNQISCNLTSKAWNTVRSLPNTAGNLALNLSGSIFVDSLTIG
jgi:hypothetical protein